MNKITICLWFDRNAEDAANFYVDTFNGNPSKEKGAKIGEILHYGKEGFEIHQMPEGTVLTVEFELEGHKFSGLNGGPAFKFTPATSFIIDCKDQAEVDYFWEKMSAVPEAEQCGWIQDKFGVSWQIIPTKLNKLFSDPDKEKAGRAMNALLQMKKIDIKALEDAYNG